MDWRAYYVLLFIGVLGIGIPLWYATRKVIGVKYIPPPPPGVEPTWTPPPPEPMSAQQLLKETREALRLRAAEEEQRKVAAKRARERREEWLRVATAAMNACSTSQHAANVADAILLECDKRFMAERDE